MVGSEIDGEIDGVVGSVVGSEINNKIDSGFQRISALDLEKTTVYCTSV